MLLNLYCYLATSAAAFNADRKGVSAMEYALMGALIAVVIVTAVRTIGTNMSARFTDISNAL